MRMRNEDHTEEDAKSVALLASLSLLNKADRVFAFVPLKSEVNITPLLSLFPIALPCCLPDGEMVFKAMKQPWKEQVKKGEHAVFEPTDGEIVTPTEKSVILVPGVAFTKEGLRLGRGGGYYDRYLENHKEAVTIGLCTKSHLIEDLPVTVQDVAVSAVLTGGMWAKAPATAN